MKMAKRSVLAVRSLGGAVLLAGMLAGGAACAEDAVPLPRAAIEQVVREYLMSNPELIREALAALQQREAAAEAAARKQALAANSDALLADPTSPVLGNPAGDVTIVEFFDYRCGYCKRVHPVVESLLQKDANVRLVLKEYPILGPESLLAAKAALAAHRQGRYAEFHKALIETRTIDEASIDALATRLGLALDKFRADRESAIPALEGNYRLANALGINGTPAFIIGDRLLPGAADEATLASHVAEVRAARQAATK